MMKNKSASILEDKFNLRLLTKPVIGRRYVFFLGHHYNGKQECYDVGAAKMTSRPIEIVRRHHKTKAEALITWDETINKLQRIDHEPEEKEDSKIIIGRG
jgi:hypothetical protein